MINFYEFNIAIFYLVLLVFIILFWDIVMKLYGGLRRSKPRTKRTKLFCCIVSVVILLVLYISTWQDAGHKYDRLKKAQMLSTKVPSLSPPDIEIEQIRQSKHFTINHPKYLVMLYVGDIVPYIFDSYVMQWPEDKDKVFTKEYKFPDGYMKSALSFYRMEHSTASNGTMVSLGFTNFSCEISVGGHSINENSEEGNNGGVIFYDKFLLGPLQIKHNPFSIYSSCKELTHVYMTLVPICEDDPLKEIKANELRAFNYQYVDHEQRGDKLYCIAGTKIASPTYETAGLTIDTMTMLTDHVKRSESQFFDLLSYFLIPFILIMISIFLFIQILPAKPVSFALLLWLGILFLAGLDHKVLNYHLSIAENSSKSLDERVIAWGETTKTFFYRNKVQKITDTIIKNFDKASEKYPIEIQKVINDVNQVMPKWEYAKSVDYKFPYFSWWVYQEKRLKVYRAGRML